MFFSSTKLKHPKLQIKFNGPFPSSFISILQVQLRRMLIVGGAWKNGCVVARRFEEAEGKTNTEKILSMTIVHVSSETTLEFITSGMDTSSRSAVVAAALKILRERWSDILVQDVSLYHRGSEITHTALLNGLQRGYVIHSPSKDVLPIGGLRALFLDYQLNSKSQTTDIPRPLSPKMNRSLSRAALLSIQEAVRANMLTDCPSVVVNALRVLEAAVEQGESDRHEMQQCSTGNPIDDTVEDNYELSECLSGAVLAVRMLMGLDVGGQKPRSILWIVVGKAHTDRVFCLPISPMLVQGNTLWYPLLEEVRFDVTEAYAAKNMQFSHVESWRKTLSGVSAALMERAIKLLGVSLGEYQIRQFVLLTEWHRDIKRVEDTWFSEVDNVWLMNKFAKKADCAVSSRLMKECSEKEAVQQFLLGADEQEEDGLKSQSVG